MPSHIEGGYLSGSAIAASGNTDFDLIFDKPFNSTPIVVASIAGGISSANYANVQLTVASRSTTGFTVRFINGSDSSALTPAVTWIAVGD